MDSFSCLWIIFSIMEVAAVVCAICELRREKPSYGKVFLCTAGVLAVMYLFLIPPTMLPDESAHYTVVLELADDIAHPGAVGDDTVTLYRDEASFGYEDYPINRDLYNRFLDELNDGRARDELVEVDSYGLTETPSFLFLPATIGVLIGRALGASAALTFFLARLLELATHLAILYWVVRTIPIMKEMVIGICLLPIVSQQLAGINADGTTIVLSFVLLTMVLRLMDLSGERFGQEYALSTKKSNLYFILMLLVTFTLSRMKFGASIPLCFLPLMILFERKARNKIEKWVLVFTPVISVLIGFIPSFMSMTAGNADEWSNYYTVSDMLADPLNAFILCGNTLYGNLNYYFYSMSGSSLGRLAISVPYCLILLLWVGLIFTWIPTKREQGAVGIRSRVLLMVCSLFGIAFMFGGMLIGWTVRGYDAIVGVQGRYFLPFLASILLSLRPVHMVTGDGKKDLNHWGVLVMMVGACVVVNYLFVRAL